MSISVQELVTVLLMYAALTGSGMYWLHHRALKRSARVTWAAALVVMPVPALKFMTTPGSIRKVAAAGTVMSPITLYGEFAFVHVVIPAMAPETSVSASRDSSDSSCRRFPDIRRREDFRLADAYLRRAKERECGAAIVIALRVGVFR